MIEGQPPEEPEEEPEEEKPRKVEPEPEPRGRGRPRKPEAELKRPRRAKKEPEAPKPKPLQTPPTTAAPVPDVASYLQYHLAMAQEATRAAKRQRYLDLFLGNEA